MRAAIGNDALREEYVREKVPTWVEEVERLTRIAESQPHAAYAAFTHGLASKWTFLARTVPDISNLFQPLEDVIRQRFLPVLTGQSPFSDSIRDLMVLPTRLGGLGIENPVMQATKKRNTSFKITASLVNLIVEQSKDFPRKLWRNKLEQKTIYVKLDARHKPLLPTVYTQPYRTPSRKPWKLQKKVVFQQFAITKLETSQPIS